MPVEPITPEYFNQKFVDLMEHFDTFLSERYRRVPKIWVDRIPKGALTNYEGLTRKINVYHRGLGEQSSLSGWSKIQISREVSGNDPGYNACNYQPRVVDYAVETYQYTGYRSSWQSEPICINDIRFVEEGRRQAEIITSFLTEHTQTVWENWSRENYVYMAVKSGNAFLLTDGGLDYDDTGKRFLYDPFVVDADGDSYLTFPASYQISSLNWSFLDWWQDYLNDQAAEAALAMKNNAPVFGLMIHMRDFHTMILKDNDLREDYRYAKADILLDDYRKVDMFRGWGLIHDSRQMRFKTKALVTVGGVTHIKAKRINPERAGRAATIGNVPEANPEYQNAEFAIGVIFMNMVMQNLIPTPISNAGGGMVFGAAPSYNGEFKWINIPDNTTNLLGEIGFFFARFEAFPKPLEYVHDTTVFLYRRCPQTYKTDCNTCCNDETAAASAQVGLAENAVAGDVDATLYTITLTLTQCLSCETGAAVTLVDDSSTSRSGYIADSALAPTYTFVLTAAPTAYTEWTAAGACYVTCA